MKKKGVTIKVSNKAVYSLVALGILLLIGGFVFAYGGTNPTVMGHSASEISGLPDTNVVSGNAIAEYGIVKADGTKLAGSAGWTVSKNSVGHYQLNLPAGDYIVLAGTAPNGAAAPSNIYISADEIHAFHYANGSFQNNVVSNIITFRQQDGGGVLDCGWNFYAIKK